MIIFEYSEAPDPHLNDQAWAAAFVLITFVLVTSLVSRALLARSRRKLEARLARTVHILFTTASPAGFPRAGRRWRHWRRWHNTGEREA